MFFSADLLNWPHSPLLRPRNPTPQSNPFESSHTDCFFPFPCRFKVNLILPEFTFLKSLAFIALCKHVVTSGGFIERRRERSRRVRCHGFCIAGLATAAKTRAFAAGPGDSEAATVVFHSTWDDTSADGVHPIG